MNQMLLTIANHFNAEVLDKFSHNKVILCFQLIYDLRACQHDKLWHSGNFVSIYGFLYNLKNKSLLVRTGTQKKAAQADNDKLLNGMHSLNCPFFHLNPRWYFLHSFLTLHKRKKIKQSIEIGSFGSREKKITTDRRSLKEIRHVS